jgi:hypothetical protein
MFYTPEEGLLMVRWDVRRLFIYRDYVCVIIPTGYKNRNKSNYYIPFIYKDKDIPVIVENLR